MAEISSIDGASCSL